MTETYTSGVWRVKPGHDDEFVQAWTEFVSWASDQPASGTFRLVHDVDDASRYMSFAPWESSDAQRAWKETDEFSAGMRKVREHVDGFEPTTWELVVEVG